MENQEMLQHSFELVTTTLKTQVKMDKGTMWLRETRTSSLSLGNKLCASS